MIRFLSILVLAASFRGCVTYEFEHEFWLNTDGSGSFVVTAPPWVWNAAKNVGEARDLDATVNEQRVAALFDAPAFLKEPKDAGVELSDVPQFEEPVTQCLGEGCAMILPVAQFEKLWGDMTSPFVIMTKR